MQELSLHILDLLQNSLEAGATFVALLVGDNPEKDMLTFTVLDNGRGMTPEQCRNATSPFTTSRKTRRVGLGLAFLSMAAEQCGGSIQIVSQPGLGTRVAAVFRHSHSDRQPLGNLAGSITSALAGEVGLTFVCLYAYRGRRFKFSTTTTEFFGGPFRADDAAHLSLVDSYFKEQLQLLYGGLS